MAAIFAVFVFGCAGTKGVTENGDMVKILQIKCESVRELPNGEESIDDALAKVDDALKFYKVANVQRNYNYFKAQYAKFCDGFQEIKIDKEKNLLAVGGAVPGRRGTLLEIRA